MKVIFCITGIACKVAIPVTIYHKPSLLYHTV